MHMADALVSPPVAATVAVASFAVGGYSVYKLKKESNPEKVPLMGIMGAFVFAAQMINFSIPGTGSSGHLCGGLLLAALLGPYGAFISMMAILLLQCLLFADGGLMAYGCNCWNMAFYACFFGYYCIYIPIIKKEFSKKRIIAASVLGSILSLQLGAFSVVIETLLSGVTKLPFISFAALMQPIHIAIGAVEGIITAAVLIFVYNTRPEILEKGRGEDKFSIKKLIAVFAVITIVIGGGLSLYASSYPDGLEWSIENVTGNEELRADDEVYNTMSSIQKKTAVLPDYSFKNYKGDAGTSFSGIIGSVCVSAVLIAAAYIFKFYRRKDFHNTK